MSSHLSAIELPDISSENLSIWSQSKIVSNQFDHNRYSTSFQVQGVSLIKIGAKKESPKHIMPDSISDQLDKM